MKNLMLILMVAVVLCLCGSVQAAEMGTAFTYQGRLIDTNSPADGVYEFRFSLYDAMEDGNQVGSTIDTNDLDVIDGYFTVVLDFGSGIFEGEARWLETAVRPGDSNDVFTTLSPRVELTPTPYAIYAQNGGAGNDWMVSGNDMYSIPSGNVGIGTDTPGAKLDVEVGSGPAATIGSGGNSATGDYAVAMGNNTTASGGGSTAMGRDTTASGYFSTAMGYDTTASGSYSTAMGGSTDASGHSSTAMGTYTTASGQVSTAMGGRIEAAGDYSVAISLSFPPMPITVTQDNTMAIMGGNVGVGTTSPDQRLSVAGTIESTSGGFKFPDGTTQTTAVHITFAREEEWYLIPANSTLSGAGCNCPEGYFVIGGGWYPERNENPGVTDKDVHAFYDRPLSNGWEVGFRNDTGYWYHLTVYAICVRLE